ncbi:MAG: nucleotide sugar dehydrogenase [Candidatus Thorarchaeota archaeon]|nr:nucleotide sugar dehydrogenase [Candidatus Thorarchaeota archaeon]
MNCIFNCLSWFSGRVFELTKKVVVIGMGYVGIPAAALLADVNGFDVTGLQRRSKRSGWKIDILNKGKSPFEGDEPGLDELIERVVKKGSFRATDDVEVLTEADVILIDVQTPTDAQNMPRYDSLREVSAQIGQRIKKGAFVIVESTVAPGTTENVVQKIIEKESGLKGGVDFNLAFSYERVMPGKLLEFITNMPRVVGGITPESTQLAVDFYSTIVKKKIYTTDTLSAELSKTIENAYRDVNIAFANEMALVCESLGVNVYEIIELINARDDRHMHIPGAGVGGHCLPKDPWLLRFGLYEYGSWKIEPEFISLARRINDHMPIHMADLIENALASRGVSIHNARVTILGLAYLEDSDDTRNSPAATLVGALQAKGAEIVLHDSYVREWDLGPQEIERNLMKAVKDSDCLALVTKHKEYFELDFDGIKAEMRTPTIVDGRNVFDAREIESKGFEYRCIGKVGIRRG